MNSDYQLFYVSLKGLTNLEVQDEIYKKMGEYCQLIEEDVPNSTRQFKEKLRVLFDKTARIAPSHRFRFVV